MKHRTWIIGLAAALFVLVPTALIYPLFSSLGHSVTELVEDVWADEQEEQRVAPGQGADVRQNLQQHWVRGAVLEVNAGEVVLETASGESVTVLITDTTRFWVPGEPLTATIDMAVGDPLLALGRPVTLDAGGKALEARFVVAVSDDDLPKVLIRGRVVVVTRQTVIVQTGRGERAITVLPRTHILSPSGKLDLLQNVQRGDLVVALGHPTRMGQWMAGLVFVADPTMRTY